MARREFARIGTDMPSEPSITALTAQQQWLYDRLLLRKEMSRCGLVPFRPAMWADLAAGATEADVRDWLAALVAGRHVVVDERYAEVLVRTFVRHDGLLSQPFMVAAMAADFAMVASPAVRLAFLAEFRRLWDVDLTDAQRGGWLLAVGQYPRPAHKGETGNWPEALPAASLGRLRTALAGNTLRDALAEALNAGLVDPFEDPVPDPFFGGSSGASAGSTTRDARPGSVLRSPPPTSYSSLRAPRSSEGPPDPGAAIAANGAHAHPAAAALVDEAGPVVPTVRAALLDQVVPMLTVGVDVDAIRRALVVWRERRAGPGLLPHLVQDQLADPQLTDPRYAGLLEDARRHA